MNIPNADQARAELEAEVDRIMASQWAPRTRLQALQQHRTALATCLADDVASGQEPYQPHIIKYRVAGQMLQERYDEIKADING